MKKRWLIGLIVIIILGILSIPKFFLVPQLVQGLQTELKQALHTQQVQVTVGAPWGWELLWGVIPKVEVFVDNAVIDGLAVAKVEIHGEGMRFNPRSLLRNREFDYVGATNLQGELTVTEEALNTLFWEEVDPSQNLNLVIEPQGISLRGKMAFWNMEWDLRLHGSLEVWEHSNLRFVPQDLEVQETRVPPLLLEILNENYDFVLDFGVFPYPLEISEISFLEEQIMIKVGVVQ